RARAGLPDVAGPPADRPARPGDPVDRRAHRGQPAVPGLGAMTSYFVAVDGGNSKTDVVVGDASGRVHATVRGPGSSPHNLGLPGSLELLDRLVGTALDGISRAAVAQASVFIAGADLPIEVERLTTAVGKLGWAPRTTVDNDTFALLRTGT